MGLHDVYLRSCCGYPVLLFSEWVLYATDPHLAEMGSIQDWAGVYPLFHWSFIPWGFYLVLAVAFGFMLHVRKRTRQKYSEACRPILGKHTDGWTGRIIDLLAVFALLAGTATTFSVATPLMATIIGELFHVAVSRTVINIIILLITCAVYTYSLLHGFKVSANWPMSASIFSLDCLPLSSCLAARPGILSKPVFLAGTDDAEFHRPFHLYRPAAYLQLPPKLDHLLLGLLDGLVCGSTVLYWQHFPWQNGTSDDSGRLCVWRGLYTDQLHCAG